MTKTDHNANNKIHKTTVPLKVQTSLICTKYFLFYVCFSTNNFFLKLQDNLSPQSPQTLYLSCILVAMQLTFMKNQSLLYNYKLKIISNTVCISSIIYKCIYLQQANRIDSPYNSSRFLFH